MTAPPSKEAFKLQLNLQRSQSQLALNSFVPCQTERWSQNESDINSNVTSSSTTSISTSSKVPLDPSTTTKDTSTTKTRIAHSIDIFKSTDLNERLIRYTIRLQNVNDINNLTDYLKLVKYDLTNDSVYRLIDVVTERRRDLRVKMSVTIVVSPDCKTLKTGSEVLVHYLYYLKRMSVKIVSTSSQISDSLLRHITHCDRFSNIAALVMQPEYTIREVEQRYLNNIADQPIYNDEDADDLKRIKRIFQMPNPKRKRYRRFTTS